MTHKHEYKKAYSMKADGKAVDVSLCVSCNSEKRVPKAATDKRGAGMATHQTVDPWRSI